MESQPTDGPPGDSSSSPANATQAAPGISRFTSTEVAGHVVFRPGGALTYEVRAEFERAAKEAAASRPRVVLDCRDTTLMDSEFLEMMLDLRDALVEAGGNLRIANLSTTCREIFTITGLDSTLATYDDLGSAVRSR